MSPLPSTATIEGPTSLLLASAFAGAVGELLKILAIHPDGSPRWSAFSRRDDVRVRSVAISFDGATGMEYPSIRFFLPGVPIFKTLVRAVRASEALDLEWVQFGWSSTASRTTQASA